MEEERNCAFQYAEVRNIGGFTSSTKIVHDESGLRLSDAKELWNKYYPQLARLIKEGDCGEMVIWINMPNNISYIETLEHISTDAESDGRDIWVTEKHYFTQKFD